MTETDNKHNEYNINYTTPDGNPVPVEVDQIDERLEFTVGGPPTSVETSGTLPITTLEFAGPRVKADVGSRASGQLESVDARSVSKSFDLRLDGTSGSVSERTIQGAEEAPNSIYLRDDEAARNIVRTGDKDDEIFMGPKGGTVDAGKGRNHITGGDGIDEIIIKQGYSGFLNHLASETTVRDFTPGQDKVKLEVQNNGWVSTEEQAAIDALPQMLSLPKQYEAAKKVAGVDKGEVFILPRGQLNYLAVHNGEGDDSAATIIGLDARPLLTDVVLG